MTIAVAAVASGCDRAHAGAAAGAGEADSGVTVDAASAQCDPLQDACSDGEYCQYVEGELRCVEEGTQRVDELCEPERCQRGTLCLPASSEALGPSCQPPCTLDGALPCANGRHACFQAVGDAGEALPFGVCRYVE